MKLGKRIWWIKRESKNIIGLKLEKRTDNFYFLISVVNKRENIVFIFYKKDIMKMAKFFPEIVNEIESEGEKT